MSKLDWTTSRDALRVAAAQVTPAVAAVGSGILDALTDAGGAYESRYDVTGVDTAKDAWVSAVSPAWDQCDRTARACLNLAIGQAIAFDAVDRSALDARIAQARSMLAGAARADRVATFGAAVAALDALWSAPVRAADLLYSAPERDEDGALTGRPSVRAMELDLAALVARAGAWVTFASLT